MLFAYFGPETIMPLTSVIAGIAGVFLMFGKNTFRVLKIVSNNLLGAVGLKKAETPAPSATPAPHVDPAGGALERRRARARANANAEAEEPHAD